MSESKAADEAQKELSPAENFKKLGNDAFVSKKFEEAIKNYSQAIDLDPETAVYYSNRSACYFSLKNWKSALEDALLCVSKDPKFIKGYYRLSAAQTELGLYNDAEATLKAALVLEPKNEVIVRQLQALQQKRLGTSKKPTRKLDEAQMKEIMELQEQTNSFGRDLRAVKNRIGSYQREQRMNGVTLSQIEPVEESVPLYRSVGKAFVFAPKTEIKERIEKENADITKNLNDLADRHEYLERRIASNTSNLQEMTAGL